jgi:hypothetical protein
MSNERNSQMIRAVEPALHLSGDVNQILDEIRNPSTDSIRYNFVVTMSLEQIQDMLCWLVESNAFQREDQAIKDGKSPTPVQLMLEFKNAVEVLLSR